MENENEVVPVEIDEATDTDTLANDDVVTEQDTVADDTTTGTGSEGLAAA